MLPAGAYGVAPSFIDAQDLHVSLEVAPVLDEYVPTGHFSHFKKLSPPVLFENLPGGHGCPYVLPKPEQ